MHKGRSCRQRGHRMSRQLTSCAPVPCACLQVMGHLLMGIHNAYSEAGAPVSLKRKFHHAVGSADLAAEQPHLELYRAWLATQKKNEPLLLPRSAVMLASIMRSIARGVEVRGHRVHVAITTETYNTKLSLYAVSSCL